MMSDLSQSSPANSSSPAQPSQPSLAAGFAALKQQNYGVAIAHLEAICQATPDPATRLKAQMGLVKAYACTGEQNLAIALCQPLCDSPVDKVRTWANQTLQELQSPQSPESPDTTGFTPLPTQAPAQTPSPPPPDNTGFVPLSSPASSAKPTRPSAQRPLNSSLEIPSTEPNSKPETQTTQSQTAQSQTTQSQPHPSPLSTRLNSEPKPQSSTLKPPPPAPPEPLTWDNAGRAQRWTSLGSVRQNKLWLAQAVTVLVLAIAIWLLLQGIVAIATGFFNWVNSILGTWYILTWSIPFWLVLIGVAAMLMISPWLLDWVLKRFYQMQEIKRATLSQASLEAARVVQRVCKQRRQEAPVLGLLPTDAPIAFTYGCVPESARIVVSQGLLDRLSSDEIATVLASEIGHIMRWDFVVMSLITLVLQVPYLIYWKVATWGDRQHDRVLQTVAVLVSSLSYGLYRALRWVGLWLSRLRIYYSDRTAVEITGNPNGLIRALLKLNLGLAEAMQHQGQTAELLESFDLLTPVGYRPALSLGSLYPHARNTSVLEWERRNPYRHWLAINNSHPPLGERLHLLTLYAQHWNLPTEVSWAPITVSQSRTAAITRKFLLQIAPWLGLAGGIGVAIALWLVGALDERLNWFNLGWLWGDRTLLIGFALIGLSLGIFTRINSLFPDIGRHNMQHEPDLAELLAQPDLLPIDSIPVRLQGQLMGRRSLTNWLNQDLFLKTHRGAIKLHHLSKLGFLGNPSLLWSRQYSTPQVTVTGWLRRGATPWIDVEKIQPQHGSAVMSYQPFWLTGLAIAIALLGIYVIFTGGR